MGETLTIQKGALDAAGSQSHEAVMAAAVARNFHNDPTTQHLTCAAVVDGRGPVHDNGSTAGAKDPTTIGASGIVVDDGLHGACDTGKMTME